MARRHNPKEMKVNVNNGNNSTDSECIVCFRKVKYYSVGICDHAICFECSARMRVLVPAQNECAICRQELEHIVFTRKRCSYNSLKGKLPMFTLLPLHNIYMEDAEVEDAYYNLLASRCKFCDEVFKTFDELKTHVQRTHELHVCDLCVEHIKLFPSERRFYPRGDLAVHKRKGDKDDTSHRGHPLCRFCDRRYFDRDSLFKHLRKDHYFCHFCDSDGFNDFYNTYDELRIHFRRDHYLCEEENCKFEKFTSVFRTEIDLKAHLTSMHSKLLGKQGMKQARQIGVDFKRDHRDGADRRGGGRHQGPRNGTSAFADDPVFGAPGATALPDIKPLSLESDFPTLASGEPGPAPAPAAPLTHSQQLRDTRKTAENPKPAPSSATVQRNNNVNPGVGGGPAKVSSKFFRPQWNAKVTGSSKMDEEFPALSSDGPGPSFANAGSAQSFNSITKATSAPVVPRVLKTAQNPLEKKQTVPSSEDFPSLGGPSRALRLPMPIKPKMRSVKSTREYESKNLTRN